MSSIVYEVDVLCVLLLAWNADINFRQDFIWPACHHGHLGNPQTRHLQLQEVDLAEIVSGSATLSGEVCAEGQRVASAVFCYGPGMDSTRYAGYARLDLRSAWGMGNALHAPS